MKKSLIALILLSGFIGCAESDSSITIRNEQNDRRMQETVGANDVTEKETTVEHLSFLFGKPFHAAIIEEPEEIAEPDRIDKPQHCGSL